MKHTVVKFSEIASHPTNVMSACYWVNIKEGKLPFIKTMDGSYRCSESTELNKAIYMTEEDACELNLSIAEYHKAKQLVTELLKKHEEL